MAGFFEGLGQGLQNAGAVLSPDVYRSQTEERKNALVNVGRALEIKKAQRALDADEKFSASLGGMQPSAFKTSGDVLDALKGVPLDIIAESPRAQSTLHMVGQMQQREAQQEQRRQQIELQYDRLDQQRELSEKRANDSRLSNEERARHNLAMETITTQMGQMRADAMRQGIELRKEMFKSRHNPDALLSEEDSRFMAEQYLAGDRTVVQNLGRGAQGGENVLRFRKAITQVAKEKGMKGPDVAAKIAEFEGIKAGERTLGTRTANIEMAVTEAQNMAPLALQASEKVDRTKFPNLNSLILAAEKGTGDENVVRLGVATNSLINIYARAISPTGVPTVSDKDHARELLATAWSKGQYRAGIDQLMQELAAARKAPGSVRKEFREAVSGDKEVSGTTPKSEEIPEAPREASKREKDKVYKTPKGNMTWTGTGWLPAN